MKSFLASIVLLLPLVLFSKAHIYEEPISDLLVKCNAYKSQVLFSNRSIHACEKQDPDGDFNYYITQMKAPYSKREFLCVLFLKSDFTKLDFKLLFSHSLYKIDAYGIKYREPQGSLFESSVSFDLSVLVVLPDNGSPPLDILEWKINGYDMCPACGEKSEVRGLISGGTETSAEQWPWHVSLWKKKAYSTNYICGGSIINKKWIVTAAHCMYDDGLVISENTLTIRIGSQKLLSASYESFSVKTFIVHEHYNRETYENDIALMKLKQTLSFSLNFRAICIARLGDLPEASVGTAVGYGSTEKGLDYSDALRQVTIPIVNQEDCLDSDQDFFKKHLFPGNFCAGEIGAREGVCQGGGFYVRHNNWYLQGITSNTKKSQNVLNPTCNYASYALFTNVTYYADWMHKKIINA